jgi:hypothetical protein
MIFYFLVMLLGFGASILKTYDKYSDNGNKTGFFIANYRKMIVSFLVAVAVVTGAILDNQINYPTALISGYAAENFIRYLYEKIGLK